MFLADASTDFLVLIALKIDHSRPLGKVRAGSQPLTAPALPPHLARGDVHRVRRHPGLQRPGDPVGVPLVRLLVRGRDYLKVVS